MSDIDLHHLSAAYAVDALDPHERQAFEAHYESCEVCRADVVAFRETLRHVAESSATPPPASLKQRVMADIATTRQLSPTVVPIARRGTTRHLTTRHLTTRRTAMLLVAAAAVLAIVVGVVAVGGGSEPDAFAAQLAALLERPDVRMVDLAPKGAAAGTFRVAWSASMGQAVLIGENLSPAPTAKAYELWLIAGKDALPMSVLDLAASGSVHRIVHTSTDPSAWAITLEPRQGSPVPTGAIMYIAQV